MIIVSLIWLVNCPVRATNKTDVKDQIFTLLEAEKLDSALVLLRGLILDTDQRDTTPDTVLALLACRGGEALHFKGRYFDSIVLYEAAENIYEKVPIEQFENLSICKHDYALVLLKAGRASESRLKLFELLTLMESKDTVNFSRQVSTLRTLGSAYRAEGNNEAAQEYFQRALEKAREHLGPQDSQTALCLNNLANLNRYTGNLVGAQKMFEEALGILETIHGSFDRRVAVAVENLGLVDKDQGLFEAALKKLERSVSIFTRIYGRDHVEVATSLMNIGIVLKATGRYQESEAVFLEALRVKRNKLGMMHTDVARIHANLSQLYDDWGLIQKSIEHDTMALAIRRSVLPENHPDIGRSLATLAQSELANGEFAKAEELANKAITIFATSKLSPDLLSTQQTLGSILAADGRLQQAESLLHSVSQSYSESLGPDHPKVAGSKALLADLSVLQGRLTEADSLYQMCIAIDERTLGKGHLATTSTFIRYSALRRLEKRFLHAFEMASNSLEIRLDSFHKNVSVLTHRDALESSQGVREASSVTLSCFFDLKKRSQAETNVACDGAIRSKGIVTEAELIRQESILSGDDSTSISMAESLRLVRYQLSTLYSSASAYNTGGTFKAELDSLSGLEARLESDLYRYSERFRSQINSRTVSVVILDSLLPARSAMVEYYCWDYFQVKPDSTIPRYLAVVTASEKTPQVVQLGEAREIDSLVESYRSHIYRLVNSRRGPEVADQEQYRVLAQNLYEKVWKPVESLIKDRDLVIVAPDGALNLVAFAGLIDEEGTYLAEKQTLHYLSAGRDLIRLREKMANGKGLLALGDPDYDASITSRLGLVAQQSTSNSIDAGLPGIGGSYNYRSICDDLQTLFVNRLPWTRAEVTSLLSEWKTHQSDSAISYFDDQATEDRFKKEAPGKRVIHLATHGYFLEGNCSPQQRRTRAGLDDKFIGENPLLLSGLLFAGANLHGAGADSANIDDGILSAYEVQGMNLQGTELVVLSACETGLGTIKQGEGVFGLRRAFQLAGARTVVSALWPVPDEMSKEMMQGLYTMDNRTLPQRIRQMQLDQIEKLRKSGRADHPLLWAAFIATGEWR